MAGGSRRGSGPPPDELALRRDRAGDRARWRVLPAVCAVKAPAWPLSATADDVRRKTLAAAVADTAASVDDLRGSAKSSANARLKKMRGQLEQLDAVAEVQGDQERELWPALWRSPQAVVWHELGWTRDVAQYLRHLVRGEFGSIDDAREARQWSDRLGLNPTAMLRLRWRVAPASEAPASTSKTSPRRSSARDRLQLVEPGAK